MKLPKEFFDRPTIEIAKNLLGCYLIHETIENSDNYSTNSQNSLMDNSEKPIPINRIIHKEGKCVGKIVETEAYLKDDPASHSFNGKTKRNRMMFDNAGKAYIYFTYGMYFCFNVVTNKKEIGEAVLIRALEPLEGIELMKKRRGIVDINNLCNGPAKLVIAMGIKKEQNGCDLLNGNLRLEKGVKINNESILVGKRIGISKGKELEHRFYIKDSKFMSIK